MGIPDVKLSIVRNGLGLAAQSAVGAQAKVGCSSLGTTNQPKAYSDGEQLKVDFGTGPMVEAALLALEKGGPVVVCKTPSSTAGAAGTVTKTGSGTGTVAVAGGALDAYDCVLLITNPSGAALASNTGLFKLSKDGGRTWGPEFAIPASGSLAIEGTGLTLTFTIATGAGFLADDKFTFSTTPPASTLTEVQAAIDALKTSGLGFELLHVVGAPAASGESAMLAALDTKMAAFVTDHLYEGAFAVMEARDDTDANIKAAYTSSSDYVAVCAGSEYIASPIDGRQVKRNVAWGATARVAEILLGTDPAKVKDGPISGVTGLSRDEGATPGLDAVGFTTMRTYKGRRGFFLTNARIFASPTSDFRYWQHRRIMNSACAATYDVLLDELHDDVLVDKETGFIEEGSARAIEAKAVRAVRDRLGASVSDVNVTIDRAVNILSTSELSAAVDIVPKGYFKSIKARVGFKNPALAAQ